MNSKILKSLLVAIFSLSLISTANAGLIEGQLYSDADGVQWEYVGYFDLYDGPKLIDNYTDGPDGEYDGSISLYNGIDAAHFAYSQNLFYGGSFSVNDTIALSAYSAYNVPDVSDSDFFLLTQGYTVNKLAWYDSFDSVGLKELSQDLEANVGGDATKYDFNGDVSAFIKDRVTKSGRNLNYVFKSVSVNVPEPSTLAIFSIALVGLSLRRNRNK